MKRNIKHIVSLVLISAMSLSLVRAVWGKSLEEIRSGTAKNVIFMIPDGMSQGGVTLARWVYNDGHKLNIDHITTGLMQTHNSNTVIADSAPAGTALATGVKTEDKMIGIRPNSATLVNSEQVDADRQQMPVASVLEAAKLHGKSTGIVVTAEVQHGTPADFSAHTTHRRRYTDISEQQVHQNMDVVLGGGLGYLSPSADSFGDMENKYRADGEDMLPLLEQKGYTLVKTREELLNFQGNKLWGGFAQEAMKRNLDKPESEPSLAEMTQKAIEILSKNEKGFFLMVEGSQVDWAAHANDTVGIISEIKAFDDAVGKALEFARSRTDTVVIVSPDHGNSGITIGNRDTDANYPTLELNSFVQYLKQASITEEKAALMVDAGEADIRTAMSQLGISDLTAEEEASIAGKSGKVEIERAMAEIVAKRSFIGYTTSGHTGEDVAIYIYEPSGQNRLSGTIDNHEMALYAAKVMGIDLEDANRKLFVSDAQLQEQGMEAAVDTSDSANPKLIVKYKEKEYIIPANKNSILNEGTEFNGVSVYSGKHFYIPQSMVDFMKNPSPLQRLWVQILNTITDRRGLSDSAPAGTSMATGVKTEDKMTGIRPNSAALVYSEQVGMFYL